MSNHTITTNPDRPKAVRTRHPEALGHRATCSCGWTEKAWDKGAAEARGERHAEMPNR